MLSSLSVEASNHVLASNLRAISFTPRRMLQMAFIAGSAVVLLLLLWEGKWSSSSIDGDIKLQKAGTVLGSISRLGSIIAPTLIAPSRHPTRLASSAEPAVFEATLLSTKAVLQESTARMWAAEPERPRPEVPPECNSVVDVLNNYIEAEHYVILVLGCSLFLFVFLAIVGAAFIAGAYVRPRPPRYWTNRPRCPFTASYHAEVDVTKRVGAAVQKLLDLTTDRRAMGKGRDGDWATHKAFKVKRVTRIENGRQWTRYAQIKRAVRPLERVMSNMTSDTLRRKSQDASRFIEARNNQLRQDKDVAHFLDSLGLDVTRNEQILFHGCPREGARSSTGEVQFKSKEESPLHAVLHLGFDDRLGSVKGMYGSGTYFADMASKADCYGGRYKEFDDETKRYRDPAGSVGETACMFLARVTLGTPYLTNQSLEQLRRPPCIHGHFDLNLSWNEDVKIGRPWTEKNVEFQICDHWRFDSVIGDLTIEGQRKLYREYVVYAKQCYPEFCVEYERIMP